MYSISSLSTEYVRVQVQATEAGVPVNPTTDVVAMAFMPEGSKPQSSDWKTASWEIDSTQIPTAVYVRALVGPGPGGVIALTPSTWDVYVKVTDNPETPVKRSGSIRVT